MSFYNSFIYQPQEPVFMCDVGVHDLCIKSVTQETSKNGAAMLVFACNVRSSAGKIFPGQHKIYLVEGPYYDKTYSRFLDCFGIPYTKAGDPFKFVNALGKAKFDFFKYNSETKKTETVEDLQCHLIPKMDFVQPSVPAAAVPATPETYTPPPSPADGTFKEDIPF